MREKSIPTYKAAWGAIWKSGRFIKNKGRFAMLGVKLSKGERGGEGNYISGLENQ